MNRSKPYLLLADDDPDDCILFQEALEELPISSALTIVNDGDSLMKFLVPKPEPLPDVLFLDLNMPRKTGNECLEEIKQVPGLQNLPVIIFSTSYNVDVVNILYEMGAHYYLRKPADFSKLRELIGKAVSLTTTTEIKQPGRENFVLNATS